MKEKLDELRAYNKSLIADHEDFVKRTEPKKVNAIRAQMLVRGMLCGFTFKAWQKVRPPTEWQVFGIRDDVKFLRVPDWWRMLNVLDCISVVTAQTQSTH